LDTILGAYNLIALFGTEIENGYSVEKFETCPSRNVTKRHLAFNFVINFNDVSLPTVTIPLKKPNP
jgi:hypothetical protein